MAVRLNCPWHKSYKAERYPRSRCEICWGLYNVAAVIQHESNMKALKRRRSGYPRLPESEGGADC